MTVTGMVETKVSANLMSLGADRLRHHRRRGRHHRRELLRLLAEAQHEKGRLLSLKSAGDDPQRIGEVIKPSLFGRYHRGRVPARTVLGHLRAAAVAIVVTGKVSEKENSYARRQRVYLPTSGSAIAFRGVVAIMAVVIVGASIFAASRMGGEFIPEPRRGDVALAAIRIPGTSLTQSLDLQMALEKRIQQLPEVKEFFTRTGTAEVATDPWRRRCRTGTSCSSRAASGRSREAESGLVEEIEKAPTTFPAATMRSRSRSSCASTTDLGVRSDVGIKIFGTISTLPVADPHRKLEDGPSRATASASASPEHRGDRRRRKERREAVRRGSSFRHRRTPSGAAARQHRGDPRDPDPLPAEEPGSAIITKTAVSGAAGAQPRYVPLSSVATVDSAPGPNQISRENGKRRIVVTANVRERDLGSFVSEAQEPWRRRSSFRPVLDRLGRAVRATCLGDQAAHHRRSGGAAAGAAAALHELRIDRRCASGVQRRPAGADRRRAGAAAARYPAVDQCGRRLIALSGVAVLNGLVIIAFIEKLRHEGSDRRRRGGAAPAGHCRHRRHHLVDNPDAAGAACPLRSVPEGLCAGP
ncbi:hypothetical protein Lal_00013075 [Lupinus albus]|nr:hypothetical protein Lal_00013075 [Lupinus albus]